MVKLCIPTVGDEEIRAVSEVLHSGWLAHGEYNKKFEAHFAEFIGVEHAITCNSCTSALFLALVAQDITGEVIVPSFSFVATANAVVTAGATPVFVDIEPETCNMDPIRLKEAITAGTQAVIPVHYAGQCCQMDAIVEIAAEHGLCVIEDSAETLGGTYDGRQAGSFGIGCFSFFPTKNITTGEGGMLTTNDGVLAKRLRALIGHGIDSSTFEREKSQMPWFRSASLAGYNFRMSNILAAMGYEQMKKLHIMNAQRQELAAKLIGGLRDVVEVELPVVADKCEHVFQMFTVKLRKELDREDFVRSLNRKGIGASVHFYPPIHEQQYYREMADSIRFPMPVTEDIARRIVTLPIYPGMRPEDVNEIVEGVKYVILKLK